MRTTFFLLCFLLAAALSFADEAPGSKFLGMAAESRKLADIGADKELWSVTVIRDAKHGGSGFPARTSIVYLTGKPKTRQWHAFFPEGTVFVMPLTRGKDGSYETVYYQDQTRPPKMY